MASACDFGMAYWGTVGPLPVVLDTTTILRRAGFRVVVSRTGPTSVLRLGTGDMSGRVLTVTGSHDDVAARDVCANMAHADVLIGVYFNSGATAANAGCITAYDSARPFAASNHGQQVIAAGLASAVEQYFASGSAP